MRYKILFISSWFPSKIEPTNGNFVQRHAEAVSLLHDVEILHAIGDFNQTETYLFDDQMIHGNRTLVVYYKNSKNPVLNFYRRMISYKKGFSKLQKPDLVHANVLQNSLLFSVFLKWKYKIPFVVTEHWSGFLKINRPKLSASQAMISKFIASKAEYILPVSYYLKSDSSDLLHYKKMKVVENVVDTDLFVMKKIPTNVFTFLHISNLISLKNPEKIVHAAVKLAAEYPGFELHIGGDGNVDYLNKIIRTNCAESFIKTFGIQSSAEVATKMRRSDCFILFSEYENFPCVILESLSSGTPVIATNVGGIPEIINPNNGILIANSETELLAAMKNVLLTNIKFQEPEKLHRFVEERFSMPVIAAKFDTIYNEVLGFS